MPPEVAVMCVWITVVPTEAVDSFAYREDALKQETSGSRSRTQRDFGPMAEIQCKPCVPHCKEARLEAAAFTKVRDRKHPIPLCLIRERKGQYYDSWSPACKLAPEKTRVVIRVKLVPASQPLTAKSS